MKSTHFTITGINVNSEKTSVDIQKRQNKDNKTYLVSQDTQQRRDVRKARFSTTPKAPVTPLIATPQEPSSILVPEEPKQIAPISTEKPTVITVTTDPIPETEPVTLPLVEIPLALQLQEEPHNTIPMPLPLTEMPDVLIEEVENIPANNPAPIIVTPYNNDFIHYLSRHRRDNILNYTFSHIAQEDTLLFIRTPYHSAYALPFLLRCWGKESRKQIAKELQQIRYYQQTGAKQPVAPATIFFIQANITTNNGIQERCFVFLPDVNQLSDKSYQKLQLFINKMNEENEIYVLLEPTGTDFNTLLQAAGKEQLALTSCDDKKLCNQLVTLFITYGPTIHNISILGCEFYPYEANKIYGNHPDTIDITVAMPTYQHAAVISYENNKDIKYMVNPTTCCTQCQPFKHNLLAILQSAQNYGIELDKEITEHLAGLPPLPVRKKSLPIIQQQHAERKRVSTSTDSIPRKKQKNENTLTNALTPASSSFGFFKVDGRQFRPDVRDIHTKFCEYVINQYMPQYGNLLKTDGVAKFRHFGNVSTMKNYHFKPTQRCRDYARTFLDKYWGVESNLQLTKENHQIKNKILCQTRPFTNSYPSCISFADIQIINGNNRKSYCFIFQSSSHVLSKTVTNEEIRKKPFIQMKICADELNQNQDDVTYIILSGDKRAIRVMLNEISRWKGEQTDNYSFSTCAEVTLMSLLRKFVLTNVKFYVNGVTNCHLYPYPLNKQDLDNSVPPLKHNSKKINLSSSNTFTVTDIACCANCTTNKNIYFQILHAAELYAGEDKKQIIGTPIREAIFSDVDPNWEWLGLNQDNNDKTNINSYKK